MIVIAPLEVGARQNERRRLPVPAPAADLLPQQVIKDAVIEEAAQDVELGERSRLAEETRFDDPCGYLAGSQGEEIHVSDGKVGSRSGVDTNGPVLGPQCDADEGSAARILSRDVNEIVEGRIKERQIVNRGMFADLDDAAGQTFTDRDPDLLLYGKPAEAAEFPPPTGVVQKAEGSMVDGNGLPDDRKELTDDFLNIVGRGNGIGDVTELVTSLLFLSRRVLRMAECS